MFPILLSLGPLKIYTFGVFLALAVIVGSFVVWREGRKQKLDEEKLLDLLLFVALFGLVGARIYYLFFHYEAFSSSLFKWLLFFHFPGLSFVGAVIGGLLGTIIFSRKANWSFWQVADLLVLGVSLGESIARIGTFLSGSAYGLITALPWGLPVVGLLGKRHPVQIYESLGAFLTFLILWKLKQKIAVKNLSMGLLLAVYLILLGLSKFFLDFFKEEVVYFAGWRTTQVVSLLFILFGIALSYRRLGRSVKVDLIILVQRINNIKNLSVKGKENQNENKISH